MSGQSFQFRDCFGNLMMMSYDVMLLFIDTNIDPILVT